MKMTSKLAIDSDQEFSLYVHFPWCVKKCPYCDFNSHQAPATIPQKIYLNSLLRDWQQLQPIWKNRSCRSIFFGGGTPSLFDPQYIAQLINRIKNDCQTPDNLEITLEANPGTTERPTFSELLSAGVNRLSLGVQSFADKQLNLLGRIHGSDEAAAAFEQARAAGFKRINIDLMYGLPQQSLVQAIQDLQTAIQLNPDHISWYQLTLEPNTAFAHTPPKLANDEIIADMEIAGCDKLAQAGFQRYEVSAYAKEDKQRCLHNLRYWQYADYLGIGAGAHSKWTVPSSNNKNQAKCIHRQIYHKHPNRYQQAENAIQAQWQVTSTEDIIFEYMLNNLRLFQTHYFSNFEAKTGLNRKLIIPTIERCRQQELMTYNSEQFALSELGKKFLNDCVSMFLLNTTPAHKEQELAE